MFNFLLAAAVAVLLTISPGAHARGGDDGYVTLDTANVVAIDRVLVPLSDWNQPQRCMMITVVGSSTSEKMCMRPKNMEVVKPYPGYGRQYVSRYYVTYRVQTFEQSKLVAIKPGATAPVYTLRDAGGVPLSILPKD